MSIVRFSRVKFALVLLAYSIVGTASAQPFVDACFTTGTLGTSFPSSANIRNADADLMNWTGSNWTGSWPGANITLAPPGSVAGTRAIWSGDGTVWTTGGEGFGLRLVNPIITGTTYTFAFRRVSHGTGQNGNFQPTMYTNTGGTFGTSYGTIPGVGTAWVNGNISFTATAASSGHTWIYFHNNVGSGMFMGCTTAILPMAFWGLQALQAGENVQLNWMVQDEENYEWHAVERSLDGIHFSETGRVPSAKAGAQAHEYAFADPIADIAAGTLLYYRIRSIDGEGKEALSPIVTTRLGNALAFETRIYPNPSAQNSPIQVEFFAPETGQAQYIVRDARGATLMQGKWNVQADRNIQTLQLQGIASGIYFLEIQAQNARSTSVLRVE
jgi:Secretion system C-terminal sorting domain